MDGEVSHPGRESFLVARSVEGDLHEGCVPGSIPFKIFLISRISIRHPESARGRKCASSNCCPVFQIFVRPLYKLLVFAVTSAYYPYCTTVGNVVLSPVMEEAVALFVEENVNSSFPRRLVNGRSEFDTLLLSLPLW